MSELFFLITIDTEGDNIWETTVNSKVTTKHASHLFRFQDMCESFDFIPTYLTNYEMAKSDAFVELGRNGLSRNKLEIGAHIHAWNQPPYYPLVPKLGEKGKPYLSEYPRWVIRRKLENITGLLGDTFGVPITSHRGGRWCLNDVIVEELVRLNYIVDCTCTPYMNWEKVSGYTWGSGGPNYEKHNNEPYKLTSKRYKEDPQAYLIEVPTTIEKIGKRNSIQWLRPKGNNLPALKEIVRKRAAEGKHVEFMLHSSELDYGTNPIFRNKGMIDLLYRDIEELFLYAKELGYKGSGLTAFARQISV
ncbi:hypothetical protein [Butyrivibrio proteoclasticus]|uniref:hypothetical protein n=1 Tax=Butyrivibrio proteoclasticus TaxID=43305 RepID=UPI000478B6C8|nr:hypothetical protein [Butyrivibrio proteoclasticus]